jgi:hypothetical protein
MSKAHNNKMLHDIHVDQELAIDAYTYGACFTLQINIVLLTIFLSYNFRNK